MARLEIFDEAKQYFKSGSWISARNALLQILQNNLNESKIIQKAFEKLGDVSLKLNQLKQCKLYYLKAMDCYHNVTNDSKDDRSKGAILYLKYGKLLHYQFKLYNESQSMYSKCIQIDKYNCEVYFHYANLLQIMQNYEQSQRYYLQCIEFNASNPKGSLHFHFAVLLYYKLSDKQNGLDHIKKAIQLKPNIAKYHFEFALMLNQENDPKYNKEINKAFESAVQLSHHQDVNILIEYGTFLIKQMNDKHKGTKFIHLASTIKQRIDDKETTEPGAITQTRTHDNINEIATDTSSVMLNISNVVDNYECVKYVIYDFDSTVTYWNLYESLDGDISQLHTMDHRDFLRIFGCRDRIRRLSDHFKSISSKGIKIILLIVNHMMGYEYIVHEALKKAYLHECFDKIHIVHPKNEINEKLKYVQNLKHKYHLKYNELLYIDDHRNVIQLTRTHCFSVFVSETNGLTLRDFENIETNMNICITNYTSFKCALPSESLSNIDKNIYRQIKSQIDRTLHNGRIDHLDVIKWIKRNWNSRSEPHKDIFLEFASKYASLCYHSSKYDHWTSMEIATTLLQLIEFDSGLFAFKAQRLGNLNNIKEAEKLFKLAIHGTRYITAYQYYGYFLLNRLQCPQEAFIIFEKSLKISPLSIKAMHGMGRTLCQLNDIKNAEYWFKKAIVVDPSSDMSHYRYGMYLYDANRFTEAQKELLVAVELWSYSDVTHWSLAFTYLNGFNDTNRCKYHMERCLDINPHHVHAKKKYYLLFNEYYNPSTSEENTRHFMLNGKKSRPRPRSPSRGTEKEFDIFWYNKLEMWLYEDCFQNYHKLFQQKNMNNILSLFTMHTIMIRDRIGIANDEHIEIIMKAIDEHIIMECDTFKHWLSTVVDDESILDEYCKAFLNYSLPIYSMDSFYRNVSSVGKLKNILGRHHHNTVLCIWQSWCDNFLIE